MNAVALRAAELRPKIESLGSWFHNLRLPTNEGAVVETAPDHPLGDFPRSFWRFFSRVVPEDLTGKSVLDIGCNAGFYSFEMARRGAARVLGVDHDARYLRQAELARAQLGLDARRVEFQRMEVYDLRQLGEQFDLVLFMGVLYHLKHPLYALEVVSSLVRPDGGQLLFQTMERGVAEEGEFEEDYPITERGVFHDPRFPRLYFVEQRYAGDSTNWWIPNAAASMAMLRSCGMRVIERPCAEVYLCERGEERDLKPEQLV